MRKANVSDIRTFLTSEHIDEEQILVCHYNQPKAVILPIEDYNKLVEHRETYENLKQAVYEIREQLRGQT